jgi:hypothetical protein
MVLRLMGQHLMDERGGCCGWEWKRKLWWVMKKRKKEKGVDDAAVDGMARAGENLIAAAIAALTLLSEISPRLRWRWPY